MIQALFLCVCVLARLALSAAMRLTTFEGASFCGDATISRPAAFSSRGANTHCRLVVLVFVGVELLGQRIDELLGHVQLVLARLGW